MLGSFFILMLTQIENKNGIISYDNALMEQIISDSLSPFKGQYKLREKTYEMTEEGVVVCVEVFLKFGTSISEFSNTVLEYIAGKVENNLELPVKSIKLIISGIYSKKIAKKDIVIEYNNKSEIISNRD